MTQRAVPSEPAYEGDYTISGFRQSAGGNVIVEVVTDRLQRLYVGLRSKHSDAGQIDQVIRHTIAALYRPPDPVR